MTRARENADLPVAMTESGGKVGVGTASPAYRVHSVAGSGSGIAGYFHNSAGSGNGTALIARGGANNSGAGAFIVQDYNGNEDFKVDGLGRVKMPSQPHFQGWFNATFGAGTSQGSRITSNIHVKENTGNMFNTSNYRWTIPVAGMYMIHLQYLKANNTSASHHVDWSVNGQGANSTYRVRASEGAQYDQPSGTWIFYLQANDYLEIYQHGSGGIHDNHASIIVRLMG